MAREFQCGDLGQRTAIPVLLYFTNIAGLIQLIQLRGCICNWFYLYSHDAKDTYVYLSIYGPLIALWFLLSSIFMDPCVADADIIFFFFSSPVLNRHRLEVYDTSTHGVVLVRNVLHASRWKCRTQTIAKKSPSGHHRTTLSGYIFTTKACTNNRKKTNCEAAISPPHVLTIWRTSAH